MVFILLIFFMVTANFVSQSGVQVERPGAQSAAPMPEMPLQIGITRDGRIYLADRQVDLLSIGAMIQQQAAGSANPTALIVADRSTPLDCVISVMDEVQLAGIERIAIAAEEQ